jgi:hypothetical protein
MAFAQMLISASNEITLMLKESEYDLGKPRFTDLMSLQSSMYSGVLLDPELWLVINNLESSRKAQENEIRRIIRSELEMYDSIEKEERLLREAGAENELTKLLSDQMRRLYHEKRLEQALDLSPIKISQGLRDIRRQIRGMEQQLKEKKPPKAIEEKNTWANRAKWGLIGLGGLATVGLNFTALAASLGFTAVLQQISGTLGSGLVGAAITEVLR